MFYYIRENKAMEEERNRRYKKQSHKLTSVIYTYTLMVVAVVHKT